MNGGRRVHTAHARFHLLVSNFASYLLIEIFPIILCHESEQREEGPPKGVEAGVVIVGVLSHPDAREALGTLPATTRRPVTLRRKDPVRHHTHTYRNTVLLRGSVGWVELTLLHCHFHKAEGPVSPGGNNDSLDIGGAEINLHSFIQCL